LNRFQRRTATLLIAKLGRLARSVAFIANLMDADVEVLACDQPFASRLTLHILVPSRGMRARAGSANALGRSNRPPSPRLLAGLGVASDAQVENPGAAAGASGVDTRSQRRLEW
jgi:hypothetical protein